MTVDHVEVALVDRQVDRFAQGASGVVQRGGEVGELHEVAEVLDCRVAPSFVEAADERRAVGWSEHHVRTADARAPLRVARMLDEFARRGVGDELASEAARNPDPLALNVGPGVAPQRERLRIVPELDADLLEYRLRVVLDELQPFDGHHVVDRHPARDIGDDGRPGLGTCGPSRLSAAATGSSSTQSFARHSPASFRRR